MKPDGPGQRGAGKGARKSFGASRLHPIPMEWMDPMSWRLPSGKALAEFALQAGFLAPLMLGTPSFKKRKKQVEPLVKGAAVKAGIEKQVGEGPDQSGSFRQTR